MIARCRLAAQRVFIVLLEEVRLSQYFAIFCAVVVGCACFYALLAPHGHGVESGTRPAAAITFWHGLYFSIVTITSLGYGDFQPVGASKVVAAAEVLFGLSMMGIIIARLTSRRLSYHVERLFVSDARKRLDEFASEFLAADEAVRESTKLLAQSFQKTPGQVHKKSTAVQEFSRLRTVLVELERLCGSFAEYLSYEVSQGNFLSIAPGEVLKRVGSSADSCFSGLGVLIISLPPEARLDVFDRLNRNTLWNARSSIVGACRLVCKGAQDEHLANQFDQLNQTCQDLPVSYFMVPPVPDLMEPPDQVLGDTSQPQETTGVPSEQEERDTE